MTDAEFLDEYKRLAHAIQTGIAYEMEFDAAVTAPKHLRTGLNASMSDFGSLGRLLIEKGVITKEEYFAAMLDGLHREVEMYEERLRTRFGATVRLL
jgi:hypothetical protein